MPDTNTGRSKADRKTSAAPGAGGQTRQAILDEASRLIMQCGVKGTSLADIARHTGISKGTLFYHFAAKNDLVYEVTDQHFSRITSQLIDAAADLKQSREPAELLAAAMETIVTDERRGRLNLYLLADAVTDNEELRWRFRDKYREYRQLVKQFLALTMPVEADERLEAIASMYVAVLNGLITQWLIEPEDTPVEQIARLMAGLIKEPAPVTGSPGPGSREEAGPAENGHS